jgi:membrane-associated phospholipid phosphatase
MKRVFAAACAAVLACHALAQGASLRIDPWLDAGILTAGLGAAAGSLALPGFDGGGQSFPLDPGSLSGLDALACLPRDEALSKASLISLGLSLVTPAAFALVGKDSELLPAAICCAEAVAWTFAAKNALKALIPKARPYCYSEVPPSGDLLDEAWESFPSGHTALAFSAVTAFAVLALELSPSNPATPWLVGGAYSLAITTAALRVASGYHFLGDVAGAALLGSAIGYVTVRLHVERREGGASPALGLRGGGGGLPMLVLTLRY